MDDTARPHQVYVMQNTGKREILLEWISHLTQPIWSRLSMYGMSQSTKVHYDLSTSLYMYICVCASAGLQVGSNSYNFNNIL